MLKEIYDNNLNQADLNSWFQSGLLSYILSLVSPKDYVRVAPVNKTFERAVNFVDLDSYCRFINKNIAKSTTLDDHNTLTVDKLREHWDKGDRELRQLLNYRGSRSRALKTILAENYNEFCKNPYLKDLVVYGLLWDPGTAKDDNFVKAKELLKASYAKLNALDDPHAICLYMEVVVRSRQEQTPMSKKVELRISRQFNQFIRARISPQSWNELKTFEIDKHQLQDVLYKLLDCLYRDADAILLILQKLFEKKPIQEFSEIYKNARRIFNIPSPRAQVWLASSTTVILDQMYSATHLSLGRSFYDAFYAQLECLREEQIQLYCEALNGYHRWPRDKFSTKYILERFHDIENSSPEQVVTKINAVMQTQFSNLRKPIVLRLLLNLQLQHMDLDTLYAIFSDKVGSLEQFEFMDDEVINFLTNPEISSDSHHSDTVVNILNLCKSEDLLDTLRRFPFESHNMFYSLCQGFLFFSEVDGLKDEEYQRCMNLIEILPQDQLNRDICSAILEFAPKRSSYENYRITMDNLEIGEVSQQEIIKFMLSPSSQNLFESDPCRRLLERLGLATFNVISSTKINHVNIVIFLEGVFEDDNNKFNEFLALIEQACQNKQEHKLPELINAVLFSQTSVPKLGFFQHKKRSREIVKEEGLPQLEKLFSEAEIDTKLQELLFETYTEYCQTKESKRQKLSSSL